MNIPIYQVDAFTSELFRGNPAAVMPLDNWLPDRQLQAIALENHLSETAFLVPLTDGSADFHIRWFTPAVEVQLCGHATLASAWVVFNKMGWARESVRFQSKSGPLAVTRQDDGWLELDFPNLPFERRDTPRQVLDALPGAP
ncbi:MAG: isomerase, partial [Marinobacter sp. 34-60-7]